MGYTEDIIRKLLSQSVQDQLRYLYGSDIKTVEKQTQRYANLISRHAAVFGEHGDVQLSEAEHTVRGAAKVRQRTKDSKGIAQR